MRKFLSILTLACLLLGMVLPAAASETPQPLYARVGEETEYQTSLSFETEETLTVRFYTGQADENLITDATFTSPPEGLTMEGPGAGGVYTLSAAAAGTYAISCVLEEVTYQISVEVTEPEPPSTTNTIPVPDAAKLSEILSSQETFNAFINGDNPDGLIYSGSGDLTLELPAGGLGSVTCGVKLEGAKLILKGASNNGTQITSLEIDSGDIVLSGIEFSTPPSTTGGVTNAITIKSAPSTVCKVVDCTFSLSSASKGYVTYAFRLMQSAGKAPMLSLESNTFNYGCNISVSGGSVWQAIKSANLKFEAVDFGVALTKTDSYIKAVFSDSISKLVDSSQTFKWTSSVGDKFKEYFLVYDRKLVEGSTLSKNYMLTFEVKHSGEYTVVKGKYPVLEKKNGYYQLKVEDFHLNYLDEVTVKSPYAAVNVTLSSEAVDCTVNTVSGTRYLTIPNLKAGTYIIKETTKTVTKTTTTKITTTSRKYSTTYQDYFLITPQGFANAVRYVKDNLVTLNCTEAGRRPISLPVASMRAAAEKGYSVLVKAKSYELTLDAAALKSMAQQAKGTTVLLHYKSLNHVTMSDVGQESVKSHIASHAGHIADLAFLVTATSDSEQIEDLQQGSIQLKIPFIILPGTEDRANEVYALQSDTVTEARNTVVADGYLTTTLLDLTEHMVFQIGDPTETTAPATEPTEETTEETEEWETEDWETEEWETEEWETEDWEDEYEEDTGGGLLRWVLIILGGMLAVVCGVLGFVFLRRRKKK